LRTIITFQYQLKKFGLVNLLASSMLCRDIFILLMIIYQPIHIKIMSIGIMHKYL
jgi:hypothetical protein